MTFNPSRQRRAAFIRSRGKDELDSLLLPLAQLVQEITPCSIEQFGEEFDRRSRLILGEDRDPKTIANFRTEIIRSLFGFLVFTDTEARPSDRLTRLLESSDQTAFFKEVAFKFQFPFGGVSRNNWQENQDLSLRPGPFILQLMSLAAQVRIVLTREEIYFYVLNAEEVQLGKVAPTEVLETIMADRAGKIAPANFPVPGGSFHRQHLKEFLDFLELGMLIVVEDDQVWLRTTEASAIQTFLDVEAQRIEFRDAGFETHDELRSAWDLYYTSLNDDELSAFKIPGRQETAPARSMPAISPASGASRSVQNAEIGRRGELIVMELERRRLVQYDRALLVKLRDRAAERHIGYDIQSARADLEDVDHDYDELIYIEVKTTRRLTRVLNVEHDVFSMTRNEWNKAKESRSAFFVYRVYLTGEGTQIAKICDPYGMNGHGVRALPTSFEIQLDEPEHVLMDFDIMENDK
jgi:hypothetical protein